MKVIFCEKQNIFYVPFIFSVLLMFFYSGSCLSQSNQWPLPEDPLKGRIIFEQKGCSKCHAVFGYGGETGSDLGRSKFYGSFLDLASVMWNHSPQMSQKMRQAHVLRPEFSEHEMLSLLAYLYFLPYLGDVGDPQNGKKLLTFKGCLNCHALGNKGSKQAGDLSSLASYASPLYMAQAMWNHSPDMESQMADMHIKRPELSGKEMVDISEYIRKANPKGSREKIYTSPGNPQRGEIIFAEKGCTNCHATEEKEGGAPSLVNSNLQQSVLEISALLWNHGHQMLELLQTKKMSYPSFEGREMADLIAYLYFLAFTDREGDPDVGKNIFINKGCSSCHDITGTKQLIGPDVKEISHNITLISMVPIMWNHAGIMQSRMLEQDLPWPEFQAGEMKHLYSYLNSLMTSNKR